MVDDPIEIEEFDHLQRAPGFLPAAKPRGTENVHQGTLQRGDTNHASGMPLFYDSTPEIPERPQGHRRLNRHELHAPE